MLIPCSGAGLFGTQLSRRTLEFNQDFALLELHSGLRGQFDDAGMIMNCILVGLQHSPSC